jgi:hypothetical protein
VNNFTDGYGCPGDDCGFDFGYSNEGGPAMLAHYLYAAEAVRPSLT